ncbi:hypothetical protein ACMA1D_15515 [Streptomyces sp. 796.1]|uniref:hypothetical protein n=1 Tax=Streptomyces sp. 796.1 TaxID=3163029 RepID=UPI0039C8F2CF
MLFLLAPAFLAIAAGVIAFAIRCLKVALPGAADPEPGWRRTVLALTYAGAAITTAAYGFGVLVLISTLAKGEDGGADSAPVPADHPCRVRLHDTTVVDYDVHFLTLRTECVTDTGDRRTVEDVPQEVRVTAAASALCTAPLATTALATRRPARTA